MSGAMKGPAPLPRKKIIFVPQNDNFGCIFTQFLTDRKHGHSQLHGFYGSSAKRSLQNSAKIIQNFTVKPKGGGRSHHRLHEYATVCPHRHRPPLIEYSFSSSRLFTGRPACQAACQYFVYLLVKNWILAPRG